MTPRKWIETRKKSAKLPLESHTASTIEETVASLDSVVDLVSAGVVVDLPEAKAHYGHVIAAVQLNGGGRHVGWM